MQHFNFLSFCIAKEAEAFNRSFLAYKETPVKYRKETTVTVNSTYNCTYNWSLLFFSHDSACFIRLLQKHNYSYQDKVALQIIVWISYWNEDFQGLFGLRDLRGQLTLHVGLQGHYTVSHNCMPNPKKT